MIDGAVLVCSLKGQSRLPPIDGDADVEGVCCDCRRAVIHRSSADARLKPICQYCWKMRKK